MNFFNLSKRMKESAFKYATNTPFKSSSAQNSTSVEAMDTVLFKEIC